MENDAVDRLRELLAKSAERRQSRQMEIPAQDWGVDRHLPDDVSARAPVRGW